MNAFGTLMVAHYKETAVEAVEENKKLRAKLKEKEKEIEELRRKNQTNEEKN